LKALFAATLGGMLSVFALPDRAEARRRPPLKTLWAVVSANGTLVRGKGAEFLIPRVGSNPGHYEVVFNRNVSNCAYTATLADGFAGSTGADQDFITQDEFVKVNTAGGNGLEDLPFHLVVNC
jgi:hypothetical protein